MAKSTLRLDTRRALKDGTFPIQIAVGHGTDLYISTGIYARESEWNALTHQYEGISARSINSALLSMLSLVTNRIMELKETGQWQKLDRAQIREMLTNIELERPTVNVPTLADAFAAMCEGRAERTKGLIRSTALKIQAFGYDPKELHFGMIKKTWVEDFYTSMKGLSVNTKAAYTKTVRRAVNWALDHDIITSDPFRHFRIRTEETRMRDLPVDKFRTLISLDLPAKYAAHRDLFLLTFYLVGINTVDLADCTADSIVNGRLEYRRHKTGKLYSIKIEPEAMEIIERYRGKKRLLRWFEKYKNYKALQGTANHALSGIGKPLPGKEGAVKRLQDMQPLEKGLSMYWARYSWATYAADLDIPRDTISEALGHSYGARVTGVYIKYNRDKVDAANRRVIDYLLQKDRPSSRTDGLRNNLITK